MARPYARSARRAALAAALIASGVAAALPVPSGATSGRPGPASCNFDSQTGKVRVEGGGIAVDRRGRELRFTDELFDRRIDCAGGMPTVGNTTAVRIEMIDGTIYENVTLDLRNGRLGPGRDGGRRDEIEFDLRFTNRTNQDEGASVTVRGGGGDEMLRAGRVGSGIGLNLNAKRERRGKGFDVDVVARVVPKPPAAGAPQLIIHGGRGADQIVANKAGEFDGKIAKGDAELIVRGQRGADTVLGSDADDVMIGGRGRDDVRGGLGDDALRGGLGRDRHTGGPGDDFLNARDGKGDGVDCGTGEADEARVDQPDVDRGVTRCEAVKTS